MGEFIDCQTQNGQVDAVDLVYRPLGSITGDVGIKVIDFRDNLGGLIPRLWEVVKAKGKKLFDDLLTVFVAGVSGLFHDGSLGGLGLVSPTFRTYLVRSAFAATLTTNG